MFLKCLLAYNYNYNNKTVDISSDNDSPLLLHLSIALPGLILLFFSCSLKALTASIIQIFFAWRIRLLTNNWYYAAFVVAAAVSGAGDA